MKITKYVKNTKGGLKTYINFNDSRFVFRIDDASLSRIQTHTEKGMMIISASKHNLSDKENLDRSIELEKDIRSAGLGFISTLGGYPEEGDVGTVEELSYVVPYMPNVMSEEEFAKLAVKLCEKYGQETVLVALPSIQEGRPVYLDKDSNIDMMFRKGISEKKEDDPYYTKFRKKSGKAFTFRESEKTKTEIIDSLPKVIRVPSSVYSAVYLMRNGEIK